MKSREEILGTDDLTTEAVPCPEWGSDVVVSVMTLEGRDAWKALAEKFPGPKYGAAVLVVACARNADRTPLFTEDDVPAVAAKAAFVLERLARAAMKLNKLGAGNQEELQKN